MAQSNEAKLQAEAKRTAALLERLHAGLEAFNEKMENSVLMLEAAAAAKPAKTNTVQ